MRLIHRNQFIAGREPSLPILKEKKQHQQHDEKIRHQNGCILQEVAHLADEKLAHSFDACYHRLFHGKFLDIDAGGGATQPSPNEWNRRQLVWQPVQPAGGNPRAHRLFGRAGFLHQQHTHDSQGDHDHAERADREHRRGQCVIPLEQFRELEVERKRPMGQEASPERREHERLEHETHLVDQQRQQGKEHDGKQVLSSHSLSSSYAGGIC